MKFHQITICSIFLLTSVITKAQTSISGIINIYTDVDSIDKCSNTIYVSSSAGFASGDRILIIQMKGAQANLSGSTSFGNLISYQNAGNYEFGTISEVSTSNIILENAIIRDYSPSDKVQLVRVPVYDIASVDALLTGENWNGITGGIVVFETDELILHANIDLSEKGFTGGNAGNFTESCPIGLGSTLYYTDTLSGKGAEKGEGIVLLSAEYLAGKGKAINGGGGGNDHNGGGAGGGNGNNGGKGGKNDETMFSCPGDGGLAAILLDQSISTDKLYLGGGGGAGHGNNNHGTDGGNGGGIILIKANYIEGNGYSIISNGGTVVDLAYGDGGGGGGAGGSICISASTISDLNISATGGKGGDVGADQCTGPGGGGSGGVLKYNGSSLWPGATINLSGGNSGSNTWVTSDCYGLVNGAQSGGTGVTISEMIFTESTVLHNSDFANAGNDTSVCSGEIIPLYASGGVIYNWSPSDFLSATDIADPISSATENINYTVTVTNENGCVDDDIIFIEIYPGNFADAGNDTSVCSGETISLHASGGILYNWSPSDFLSATDVADPVSSTTENINYIVTVTSENGCVDIDTVSIEIFSSDFAYAGNDTSVCSGETIPLHAGGGILYNWSPSDFLSATDIADPVSSTTENINYIVAVTSADGCIDNDTISIEVFPGDFADAGNDTAVCSGFSIPLFATGGDAYVWSPSDYLSDVYISNPVSNTTENITYTVTITNASGCIDEDSISIDILPAVNAIAGPDTIMCGVAQIYLHAEGGDTYQWSPSSELFYDYYSDPLAVITESIEYVVTVTNSLTGCFDSDTASIEVLPTPSMSVSNDTTICLGEEVTLEVSGAEIYAWTPASEVPCIDCPVITVSPEETTIYYITGTNAEGCADIDSIIVSVKICDAVYEINTIDAIVFPNPAIDNLFIQFHNSMQNTSIELADINGRILQAEQKIINSNTITIDLRNIPSQIVFLKIHTPDGIQVAKVLVNKK